MAKRTRAKPAPAQNAEALKRIEPVVANRNPVAPPPLVDKVPFVLGSNVTLAYLSNVYRNATYGYRQQYVDALNELIERDPHGFAVVSQRVLTVAGGRLEVVPVECEPDSPDDDMAKEIAERFQRQLDDIPRRTQALAALQWGVFYGLSCAEVMWSRTADGWTIDSLESVHSRRLAYPDPSSWDAHIWDLGTVSYWGPPSQTSNLVGLGVRIDDYPGKFILHHANLRGDYPTREGLGREIGFWLVLKGMAARGAAEYIERFAKPWATSYYSTGKDGHPRVADDDDIAIADRALRGLGAGGLAYANLPDSVKLDLQGPGFSSGQGGVAHLPYMAFVDTQIAIAALGQADTTKAGPNGSRAAVETRKEGSKELYRYDASGLGQSLRDGMAVPWTHLNYAGLERLTPIIRVHVDEQPAPSAILELATKAAAFNIPIDANAMPERLGLPGIDPDDEKARPMVPIKLADWHDAAGEEPEPAAVALPGQQPGQQLNGAAPQEPPANDVTADPNEDGTEDPLAAE